MALSRLCNGGMKGIGIMKEEIAALKDRITDLKEKLQEIRGYL